MFTGLVEDVGTVVRVEPHGTPDPRGRPTAVVLVIEPSRIPAGELQLGESIAVDGTCLTVTAFDARGFQVLASLETLDRTTVGGFRPGTRVNLERALAAGSRLGGHLVNGHVDGVGEVVARAALGEAESFRFRVPPALRPYLVEKGSVAVDGVSLTVNVVDDEGFTVALIPHTLEHTTLADRTAGARVNLEVDIVAKYVENFVRHHLVKGA